MRIERVRIAGFRNFGGLSEVVLPQQGILVAAAPNATGKTNFLEAVFVMLRNKSFRSKIHDCVNWESDSFSVEGSLVTKGGEKNQLSVRYLKTRKKIRSEINGEPASVVSLYASYPVVLFLPEDAFLFDRGPAMRRNFLNQVLVANKSYLANLVQLNRVLKQRNTVLKRGDIEEASSWTDLLAEHAQVVWQHREALIDLIKQRLADTYYSLTNERLDLDTHWLVGTPNPDQYQADINNSRALELKYKHTFYGPHRDDFVITVGDKPAINNMSRGQLRSLSISLKVIAHQYLKTFVVEEPILLLDDVFSELDEERQVALLQHLPAAQVILTCTTVPPSLQKRDRVFLLDLRSLAMSKKEADRKNPSVDNSGGVKKGASQQQSIEERLFTRREVKAPVR